MSLLKKVTCMSHSNITNPKIYLDKYGQELAHKNIDSSVYTDWSIKNLSSINNIRPASFDVGSDINQLDAINNNVESLKLD